MKKLFYFFAAATIVLAASCNKEKEDVQYAENPLKRIAGASDFFVILHYLPAISSTH